MATGPPRRCGIARIRRIFLAPALALVVALFPISLHPLFGWALVLWPVGGFLNLVWEMPRAPREPWDDGSRI